MNKEESLLRLIYLLYDFEIKANDRFHSLRFNLVLLKMYVARITATQDLKKIHGNI